jgi:hypothetical protein
MAEPYRSRTNPGGSTALSGASPEAFGAGIGRGIAAAGGEVKEIGARLEREAELKKARDRQSENAAAAVTYATIEAELAKTEIDNRANLKPGAEGHSEAIGKVADERITAALGQIKDPEVRQSWQARFTDLRGRTFNQAYAFERVENSKQLISNAGEATRLLAVGQETNPNGVGYMASRNTIEAMWNGFDLPEDAKQKGIKGDHRQLSIAFIRGMSERDPERVLQGADGKPGFLEAVATDLEPEDVAQLRDRAQAEWARLQAAEKAKKNAQEAVDRDWIQSLGVRIGQGDYSIKDEDLAKAETLAAGYGDQSVLANVKGWRSLRNVSIETRDFTPADWQREVGKIQKIDPEKRTQEQALRLKHLEQLRGPAEARLKSNPHEVGDKVGDSAPAIDWANPSPYAGQERLRWNDRNVRTRGATSAILNPSEVQVFQERIKSGGLAGQLETARIMRDTFGVDGGRRALQQISGGNQHLQLMVTMPPETAADYRLGVEAISRNKALLGKDVAGEVFANYRLALPPELQGPVWDAARAIAAQELAEKGNVDPKEADYRRAFINGVHRAVGGTANRGGGFMNFGAEGTPIWLPSTMNKEEAGRRLGVALREPAKFIPAAGAVPYYRGPNGKLTRYTASGLKQAIEEGRLQSVGSGVYRVLDEDGGHIVTQDGGYWQFDIRKLK